MKKVKVLFVCMGNICRSPTGQGVLEKLIRDAGLADRVEVDSAGTHAYHTGEQPDGRATKTALRRGIDLSGQKARRVSEEDFHHYDYVLAMDSNNLQDLLAICPDEHREKVSLFLAYADDLTTQDVPDPYYGGNTGFERVLDLVETGAQALLADIQKRL